MPVGLRDKPIQILLTLNEWLIGIAIVPNPDQDLEIAWVLRLSVRKHRHVDISELKQFCGVYILFAEIEVRQFNMLVLARTSCY